MSGKSLAASLALGNGCLLSATACTDVSTASGVADAEVAPPAIAIATGCQIGACSPLTENNPAFTTPSWGNGIVFEGSGFPASASVTLVLATVTGPNSNATYQTHAVYTDGSGNLGSVWSPATPPQAPDSTGHPRNSILAEAMTSPVVLSCPADINLS